MQPDLFYYSGNGGTMFVELNDQGIGISVSLYLPKFVSRKLFLQNNGEIMWIIGTKLFYCMKICNQIRKKGMFDSVSLEAEYKRNSNLIPTIDTLGRAPGMCKIVW